MGIDLQPSVPVARYYGDGHAVAIQAKLAAHGIKSARGASLRPYPMSIAAGSAWIYVLAEDEDEAREILGEAASEEATLDHANDWRRRIFRVAAVVLVAALFLSGRACSGNLLSWH